MSKVPTTNNNNNNNETKFNNKCSKVADKQYIQRQQLPMQSAMGCNTSRYKNGASTLDPASGMTATTSTSKSIASASLAQPTTVRNVLRIRKKFTRGTHKAHMACSVMKPKASTKLKVALSGNVSESVEHCIPSPLLTSSADVVVCCNTREQIVGVDNLDKAKITSIAAEDATSIAYSGLPRSALSSKTTKTKTSTKIGRRKTHGAALTATPLPCTHTRVRAVRSARAAAAASQLVKEKKITTSTTTTKQATATTLPIEQIKITATTAATATATEAVEAFSDTTRRTQSSARLTSPATMSIAVAAQVGAALTAVDVKSKFTENKCPLSALTNVSNQRKVEANSTIPAPEQCTLNSSSNVNSIDGNISYISNRTSEVPSNKWRDHFYSVDEEYKSLAAEEHNSIPQDITRILNLAARKAKLKSEFFRDFELQAHVTKRLTQSSTLLNICGVDFPKSCSQSQADVNATQDTSHQSISWSTTLPTISVNAADTASPISLVARRKLDLKRKFEQKSTPKTSPNGESQFLIGEAGVFPRVEQLVQKFDSHQTSPTRKMIGNPNKSNEVVDSKMLSLKPDMLEQRNSPLSDEGCTLGQSPYSSDNEENESTAVAESKRKDKVARSASSDSALGLDVDESMDTTPAQPPTDTLQRRMTLTVTDLPLRPALLPLAEPTALPDSPTIEVQQTVTNAAAQISVPSKVLLEERVVELPEDPRSLAPSQPCSRRESAQSCISDYMPTEFPGGRRFVRTPSVVVSDYSDDVMCGITLEEIEYFRAQRMKRRHSSLDTANEGESDVSASSSCSNLYYCGSTISALDGNECYVNGVRTSLDRKTSDCSTCSVSADEETFTIPEDPPQQTGKDLADLLAAQHLSAKATAKKVGLVVPMCDNLG